MNQPVAFLFTCHETFATSSRGLVFVGRLEHGTMRLGNSIEVDSEFGIVRAKVKRIESFRKELAMVSHGIEAAIMLSDFDNERWRLLPVAPPEFRECPKPFGGTGDSLLSRLGISLPLSFRGVNDPDGGGEGDSGRAS